MLAFQQAHWENLDAQHLQAIVDSQQNVATSSVSCIKVVGCMAGTLVPKAVPAAQKSKVEHPKICLPEISYLDAQLLCK